MVSKDKIRTSNHELEVETNSNLSQDSAHSKRSKRGAKTRNPNLKNEMRQIKECQKIINDFAAKFKERFSTDQFVRICGENPKKANVSW